MQVKCLDADALVADLRVEELARCGVGGRY